jgi:dTMP kinase
LLLPTLAKGTWIICDRYADSTRVYQGELGGIDAELIEKVIKFTTNDLQPDLTFIMDCPVDIALKRLQKRDKGRTTGAVRYDSASSEFHQKLREAHLRLAKKFSDRIVVIDASHTPEESLRQAIMTLKERFKL